MILDELLSTLKLQPLSKRFHNIIRSVLEEHGILKPSVLTEELEEIFSRLDSVPKDKIISYIRSREKKEPPNEGNDAIYISLDNGLVFDDNFRQQITEECNKSKSDAVLLVGGGNGSDLCVLSVLLSDLGWKYIDTAFEEEIACYIFQQKSSKNIPILDKNSATPVSNLVGSLEHVISIMKTTEEVNGGENKEKTNDSFSGEIIESNEKTSEMILDVSFNSQNVSIESNEKTSEKIVDVNFNSQNVSIERQTEEEEKVDAAIIKEFESQEPVTAYQEIIFYDDILTEESQVDEALEVKKRPREEDVEYHSEKRPMLAE